MDNYSEIKNLDSVYMENRELLGYLQKGYPSNLYIMVRHRKQKNFIGHLTSDDGQLLSTHEDKEKNIFNLQHRNGMSQLTWRLWAYPDTTCLSWKHQSQKRKFGRLLALSLQTKLQGRMASLETFIRPAGL
jgi:hypothetical protein